MTKCFFVSDLHGKIYRYQTLFTEIELHKPEAVFLGGDLLPSAYLKEQEYDDFFQEIIYSGFKNLQQKMHKDYPEVFLILGNDDSRAQEYRFIEAEKQGLWNYLHMKKIEFKNWTVYGYSYIPPTPFLYKDWERYDVSRFVDPGCVHPTEGQRFFNTKEDIEFCSIKKDLEKLFADDDLSKAILLFHSPPYKSLLDRAALDGVLVDHVPLDVHVGSIAVKELIEERKPLLSLHGHIHESSEITGEWKDKVNTTTAFNAAIPENKLSIIIFDPDNIEQAERLII